MNAAPAAEPVLAVPSRPAAPASDPTGLLKMSRGFSCVFWSLSAFSAAHGLAWRAAWPTSGTIALLLAPFLPLACGLWMLRGCGDPPPRWRAQVGRVAMLAAAAAGLCPFLAWWTQSPLRLYFAANAAAYAVVMLGLLAGVNRLAGECARGLEDAALRREAQAGFAMVLWLGGCTVGALAWLFHRSGLLEAGLPTVLAHLAELPDEARYLFLLPYAMTAYVVWRAKETGFRRAVSAAS